MNIKIRPLLIVLAIFFAGSLRFSAARAQSFSIDWFTIDAGGGVSTGGVYAVSGTIGQPDAGHMDGGNFSLDGGFWAIIAAMQTPGAPALRVFLTATNAVGIAWPYPSTGFALEQNPAFAPEDWNSVTNAKLVAGSEYQVFVAPPLGNRFYRLRFTP